MKSGSGSAIAFGCVLKAARKHLSKSQSAVATFFDPKLSVAAVSMAESGNRPPKTEDVVRTYADALELDDDALVELWWAMQGLVEIEDWADERRPRQMWWRELRAEPEAEDDYLWAQRKAGAKWNPNEDFYAPSLELFALAHEICKILRSLLGETWEVSHKDEMGLREPIEGRIAEVTIELRSRAPEEDTSIRAHEVIAAFACPEPVTRPIPQDATMRPDDKTMPPDIAWILSSVEAMPARDRAAVAGFIHGLREGANLFSGASPAASDVGAVIAPRQTVSKP